MTCKNDNIGGGIKAVFLSPIGDWKKVNGEYVLKRKHGKNKREFVKILENPSKKPKS